MKTQQAFRCGLLAMLAVSVDLLVDGASSDATAQVCYTVRGQKAGRVPLTASVPCLGRVVIVAGAGYSGYRCLVCPPNSSLGGRLGIMCFAACRPGYVNPSGARGHVLQHLDPARPVWAPPRSRAAPPGGAPEDRRATTAWGPVVTALDAAGDCAAAPAIGLETVGADGIDIALARYEATRKPRTSDIQGTSSKNTWMRQNTDPGWVYGYDAWTDRLAS